MWYQEERLDKFEELVDKYDKMTALDIIAQESFLKGRDNGVEATKSVLYRNDKNND